MKKLLSSEAFLICLFMVSVLAGVAVLEVVGGSGRVVHAQIPSACNRSGTFTSAGASPAFDNTALGCYQWRVTYTSSGFTVLSIQFESSNDGSSWTAFSGATVVIDGSNPSTDIHAATIGIHSNAALVRLRATVLTGSGQVTWQYHGANSTLPLVGLAGSTGGTGPPGPPGTTLCSGVSNAVCNNTSNTYTTGTQDFTGATATKVSTQAPADNSTNASSTAYADAVAFRLFGCASTTYQSLTDAAPIVWAAAANRCATVTLNHTTGTRNINITGLVAGSFYWLILKQDGTGGAVINYGTGCTFLTVNSNAPHQGTDPAEVDAWAIAYDGTNCYVNPRLHFQ